MSKAICSEGLKPVKNRNSSSLPMAAPRYGSDRRSANPISCMARMKAIETNGPLRADSMMTRGRMLPHTGRMYACNRPVHFMKRKFARSGGKSSKAKLIRMRKEVCHAWLTVSDVLAREGHSICGADAEAVNGERIYRHETVRTFSRTKNPSNQNGTIGITALGAVLLGCCGS
jgi:hypothetical protein